MSEQRVEGPSPSARVVFGGYRGGNDSEIPAGMVLATGYRHHERRRWNDHEGNEEVETKYETLT